MSKKKIKYNDVTASAKAGENFGTLFPSMLESDIFQSLSNPAKILYMACRVVSKTEEASKCLYAHSCEDNVKYTEYDFVCSAKFIERYAGINRKNATKYFNELIEKGFIEKLEANKHRKDVNVYSFSTKWKEGLKNKPP